MCCRRVLTNFKQKRKTKNKLHVIGLCRRCLTSTVVEWTLALSWPIISIHTRLVENIIDINNSKSCN